MQPMKMEMTELGPMKRALKIEVPIEEVAQRFAQAYKELNRQVHMPGFRPGKAPLALLEKRYAKAIEDDVIRSLVPDFYDRAVRQAGISPVLVEIPPLERVKIKKDAPFTFTATVEIKPTIDLRDYKAPNPISLKPDKRSVTDEQVAKGMDVLREQHARLDAAPAGHRVAEGDFVVLSLSGHLDGQPLEGTKKEGHLHRVGSKATLLGLEVDPHLLGKTEGESITLSQPYPASHPDSRVAGKTVVFTLVVSAVKVKKLPDLDDELAKDCGAYASLAELTDRLRGEMEKALKREVEEQHKDTIIKRLVETHHFDLPDTLVERELEAIIRQHVQQQQRAGNDTSGAETVDPTQLRQQNRDEAMRRVKVGLILEAIAEKEKIAVSQEDVNGELVRLAHELKIPQSDLVKMIQAGGQDSLAELRARILAEKSLDFVYRNAVIQG
ncbi:Trigger factor [Nitrospira japonica]|uniref:Trigger factor n=1 Tax=Nitrospira japonica TaxID=1325564 RepID=A0A1W1I3D9_9BACT|nr:trigger factor [Nitrospira japonica]SLM47504.1 Trigger factor [Nitrospira japonica]